MSGYSITCNSCDYGKRMSDQLRSYQLDGDERLTIRQAFAWCSTCKEIVWAEVIQDIQTLEDELTEWLVFLESPHDDIGDDYPHEQTMSQRIAWRRMRVSPPKCLECGSTEVSFAKEIEDEERETEYWEFIHPECGGLIHIKGDSLVLNRSWTLYTPEGDLIGSGWSRKDN
jgi:hypothetical protein